ncbi:hypothetical protein B7G55_21270 [Aeromonas hydrophila]|uniref:hypothetical protein n=1 Tax=Aeromonas hydrophila TaxID=644 RepID=UPI000A1DAD2B|nr:hypothetical protein [Aeromonas hydrophila]OSP49237.1 hypothetical protein B7G55_21270 [Aeromonas hydrophila]
MTEAKYEKDVMTLTRVQALIWLKKNDTEYDWVEQNLPRENLVIAIRDNLRSFGEDVQAPGLWAVEFEGEHD